MNYTWQSLKNINQKRLHYNRITVLVDILEKRSKVNRMDESDQIE